MPIEPSILKKEFWLTKNRVSLKRLFWGGLIYAVIVLLIVVFVWVGIDEGMDGYRRLATDGNAMAFLLYGVIPINVISFALTFLPVFLLIQRSLRFNALSLCFWLGIWATLVNLVMNDFDYKNFVIPFLITQFLLYFISGAYFWKWINHGETA